MKNKLRTALKSFCVIFIIMMAFLIISGCSSGENEMDESSEATTEFSTEEELVVDGYRQINQTKAQKMMDEADDYIILDVRTAEEDKLEKILENQQVLVQPIVRNGKKATIGYQPDVWKGWD